MTEVYLHGILAKKFRPKYSFSLGSAREVFSAIDSTSPDFMVFLQNNANKLGISILFDQKVKSNLNFAQEKCARIDIVPSLSGTLFGLGLLGWGLLFGAGAVVVSIIYAGNSIPPPEMDNSSEQSVKTKSYLFQGNMNTQKQGKPVPLGYGRLKVGSYVVGSQVWNRNLFKHK